jgi:hypothetical protein
MHLDAQSRVELGRERIAMRSQVAERDRLRRSVADKRGEHWQYQRLLRRALRRSSVAQARAQ